LLLPEHAAHERKIVHPIERALFRVQVWRQFIKCLTRNRDASTNTKRRTIPLKKYIIPKEPKRDRHSRIVRVEKVEQRRHVNPCVIISENDPPLTLNEIRSLAMKPTHRDEMPMLGVLPRRFSREFRQRDHRRDRRVDTVSDNHVMSGHLKPALRQRVRAMPFDDRAHDDEEDRVYIEKTTVCARTMEPKSIVIVCTDVNGTILREKLFEFVLVEEGAK